MKSIRLLVYFVAFMLYNIYPLKLISVYTNQINYSKYFKQFVSRLGNENKSLRIHYHGSGAAGPVHPLEVLLVEVLDGFPLEFKCRGDQPRLRGPGVLAQRHGACSRQWILELQTNHREV